MLYATVLFALFLIVKLVEEVKEGVVSLGLSNALLTFNESGTFRLPAEVVFTNSKNRAKTAAIITIVFAFFRVPIPLLSNRN